MVALSRHGGFLALMALLALALFAHERWPATLAPERPAEVQAPARPAPVERFTAIDGDSLRNGSGDVRLAGIDAPELSQTCRRASGQIWHCGREAHQRLRSLVARGVHCRPEGRDRYGRTLARCYDGERDVGEVMVREGHALDFMGGGYASAEAEARGAKRGIWAGDFDLPQDHRRSVPRASR